MSERTNGLFRKAELLNSDSIPSRRKVLGWFVAGINVVVVGAVFGPVLGFISAPLRRKGSTTWVAVLDEAALPVGKTKEVSFILKVVDGFSSVDRKYTVFLRRHEDRVSAFDPACTHLGCRIKWIDEKESYFCPCHGGVFDSEGKVVSGPPPKPLDEHPVKVEKGKIWVQKQV